mmetsp:Transcript_17904/g.26812  ORF Transcript_17904/g.26812 Transcript_17904/m.26812 type:complete len:330 (-) Transcript_17904:165-1154(-)
MLSMLVPLKKTGLAIWKTQLTPAMASLNEPGFSKSASKSFSLSSAPLRAFKCVTFMGSESDRTVPWTMYPCSRRIFTTCTAMKPLAPVTHTRPLEIGFWQQTCAPIAMAPFRLFFALVQVAIIVLIFVVSLLALTISGTPFLPVFARRLVLIALRKYKGRKKKKFNYHKIENGIFIGRQPPTVEDMNEIVKGEKVHAILTLLEPWEFILPTRVYRDTGTRWVTIEVLDCCAPTIEELKLAVKFVEDNKKDNVYVHCNGGVGRSATVIAAYIMKTRKIYDVDQVAKLLRAKRPQVSYSLTRWPFSQQSRILWQYSEILKAQASLKGDEKL